MIELLGFAYEIAKDLKEHFTWEEQEKVVDRDWLDKSGFEKALIDAGYKLYWSRPDSIATHELDGYSIMYQLDKGRRIRYRIVRHDGITLIGKVISDD